MKRPTIGALIGLVVAVGLLVVMVAMSGVGAVPQSHDVQIGTAKCVVRTPAGVFDC